MPGHVAYWDDIRVDGVPLIDMGGARKLNIELEDDEVFTGTFVSTALDTREKLSDDDVDYHEISWSGEAEDKIKFQISHSSDNESWSDFLGPDGTNSSYYTEPGSVIRGKDGYRYLKVKAIFTSGTKVNTQTLPELDNVVITYSDASSSERDYVSYYLETE